MKAEIKVYAKENSIFIDFCIFNDVNYKLIRGTDDYRVYEVEYDDGYLLYLMGRYISLTESIIY